MQLEARVLLLLFTLSCLLTAVGAADVTEPLGKSRSAAAAAAALGEERLHPQRAVEINSCLHQVSDVGCDTYACLEYTTCHLDDNLYEICTDFRMQAILMYGAYLEYEVPV
ncbi:stanniocalcin-1-like isoform X2 [Pristis pectinata]|uniref:stanniocalcin-1-like isoform X2 n=1 Tax=Pristis pectinata TaxID=685728 RepID=UPI00223D51F9|nr:stanniocalcin-1-like isoform X2 [Pristis pectinata]